MVLVRTLSALVVGLRGERRVRCVACSSTALIDQPNSRGKWVNPSLTVRKIERGNIKIWRSRESGNSVHSLSLNDCLVA
jgi:hypothetical protein